jgi:hypothetical protein
MSNTEIWDKLRRVPKEHLKGFTRAGGFKGTAIKPMWTIHRMTEEFGACGTGWGINEPQFTIQAAGADVLVFCVLSVWYQSKEQMLWGVGGDKVAGTNKYGPVTDDEAYKKAFTDALTNALKSLGAGADVHMGLFDGSKYVDEKPGKKMDLSVSSPDDDSPDKPFPELTGTQGRPKYKGEKNDAPTEYLFLQSTIRALRTENDLLDWIADETNKAAINKLPADWIPDFREEYKDRLAALRAAAA